MFLSVNVTVCLYAPTPKRTAKFEGWNKENDEGSEEEMNMTDERGRRWISAVSGRETSGLFNAGLTPCSHTTTTKRVIEYSPPGEYLNNLQDLNEINQKTKNKSYNDQTENK